MFCQSIREPEQTGLAQTATGKGNGPGPPPHPPFSNWSRLASMCWHADDLKHTSLRILLQNLAWIRVLMHPKLLRGAHNQSMAYNKQSVRLNKKSSLPACNPPSAIQWR